MTRRYNEKLLWSGIKMRISPRRIRKFFFFAAVLSLMGIPALHSAVFDTLGMGARSAAMGGAFVAVRGYESVFWNPAGIAKLKEKTVHSEYRNPYGLNILRYITAGYLHPQVGKGTVGFSWLRLETAGEMSSLDYSENTIMFSYGTYLLDPLLLGVSGKFYRVNSSVGASGMGVDFGLSYFAKGFTMAAAVQDLNRPVISWDSGAKDRLPLHLRAGVSTEIFRDMLVSGQVSWKDDDKKLRYHLGLEQPLFRKFFTLRFGGISKENQWSFSWGMGLRYRAFRFDYAWERTRLLGDTQVFSAALEF